MNAYEVVALTLVGASSLYLLTGSILTVYLGNPTREQIRRLLQRFYPQAGAGVIEAAVLQLARHDYSMAALQGVLMRCESPERLLCDSEQAAS
jgi:hypothetical protein